MEEDINAQNKSNTNGQKKNRDSSDEDEHSSSLEDENYKTIQYINHRNSNTSNKLKKSSTGTQDSNNTKINNNNKNNNNNNNNFKNNNSKNKSNHKEQSEQEKEAIQKIRFDQQYWKSVSADQTNDTTKLLNSQHLSTKENSNKQNSKIKFDLYTDLQFFENQPVQQIFKMSNNCVISETSAITQTWAILITISLMFQIVVFPQETQSETWLETDLTYLRIQLGIEWLFLIDIVLNFFTVCTDEFGKSLLTISEISKNQVQNWFLVDLISSIPANNLTYFGLLNGNNINVYLKVLKLPKQTRIFRGIMSVFGSKLSDLQVDSVISFNNNDQQKYQNIMKYFIMFIALSNLLVCMLISFTFECEEFSSCNNWFFAIMADEFDYSLSHKPSRYQSVAKGIQDTSETMEMAQLTFQNYAYTNRTLLQINGYYFILQTVTTVGQGDVGTSNSMERVFRSICMIIGVILFTLLSSSVLETTISESLNIYKNNIHEVMIEKLTLKYDLKGAPRRYLSLLGDSVQTMDLWSEKNFIDKLPRQMRESVMEQIQNIQSNKLNVLREEGMQFFISFMKIASFRRCVVDEIIDDDEDSSLTHNEKIGKISMVYSGNLVCLVSNLNKMLNQDNLKSVEMGDEVGAHNQLNLSPNTQNYQVRCACNSEIVEVKAPDFFTLIIKSLKSLQQIQLLVEEYINELQMICSLYQSMLKQGLQIDYSWQRSTLSDLRISKKDFVIFEKIYQNIQQKGSIALESKQDVRGKWYEFMIDNDSQRQICTKNKMRLRELVRDKYISMLKVQKINR